MTNAQDDLLNQYLNREEVEHDVIFHLMGEMILDQPTLLTNFADNTSGLISAEDGRDLIVSTVHILPSGQANENIIVPETAAVVPLSIQAATSQSADLLNILNSSAEVIASINASGQYTGDGSQLSGIVPSTREIIATSPLTGGTQSLTGNVTIGLQASSGSQAGSMSAANYTKLNAATSIDTASTIVERDGSGNFSAGQINITNIISTGTTSLDNGAITTDGEGDLTAGSLTATNINATGSIVSPDINGTEGSSNIIGNGSTTTFYGSGANLTALDGSNISSGTVAATYLPLAGTGAFGVVETPPNGALTNTSGSIGVHVDGTTIEINSNQLEVIGVQAGSVASAVTGVANPVNATDAANKSYVDATIQGLQIKSTANLATAAALPANAYLSGVLTATTHGALSVDGVAVAVGNLILVIYESAAANNGLYVVTATGGVSAYYVLTRNSDMSVSADFSGAFVPVDSGGTVNANTLWLCNPTLPFVLGVGAVPFVQLNGATDITATLPLSISGNTISINAATDSTAGSMSAADKTKLDGATSADTASKIVARDSSGNFAAGQINVTNIISTGTTSLDNGNITTDGSGDLTANSVDLASGVVIASGTGLQVNGAETSFAVSGGYTSLDSGDILTDTHGNLTAVSFIGNGSNITALNASNISSGTLGTTEGGTGVTTGLTALNASNLTSGTAPVAHGGTGSTTAFTTGSVVFAGASGVYSQDNTNLNWSDSSYQLTIGSASGHNPSVELLNGTSTYTATLAYSSTNDTLSLSAEVLEPASDPYSLLFVSTSNEYVSVPHSTVWSFSGGDFTVSCWFKTSTSQLGTLVSNYGATSYVSPTGFTLMIGGEGSGYPGEGSATTLTMVVTHAGIGGLADFCTTNSFCDGNWHNVIGIYSHSTGAISLYVDGASQTASSYLNAASVNCDNTQPLTIGAGYDWRGNQNNPFNGNIDDVRIYASALSSADIAVVSSGSSATAATPVGWWKFNEGTGTTTADAINGNTGTLTHSPTWSTSVPSQNPGPGSETVVTVTGVSIQDGATFNEKSICTFGDTSSRNILQYGPASYLQATCSGTEVFRLDSSGNVHLENGVLHNRTAHSASYSILTTDYLVAYTSTSSAYTATLPTAVGCAGQVYVVKDESGAAGTNNITIATTSSQTIDGSSTATISTNYGLVRVYSNGTEWFSI